MAALVALCLVTLLEGTKRRAARKSITAKMVPTLSHTPKLVITRHLRMVIAIATVALSMSRHNTQAVDVAKSTPVRSVMSVAGPTATSRALRLPATVVPVDMSVGRSVVFSTAVNGAPRRRAKASTAQGSTTLRRKSKSLTCTIIIID